MERDITEIALNDFETRRNGGGIIMHYDREGNPIQLGTWAMHVEDPSYKFLLDENAGRYWVSTVWLGMDHSFGDGPPIIFETMAFVRASDEIREITGLQDVYQIRYHTEAEAREGHVRVVAMALANQFDDEG